MLPCDSGNLFLLHRPQHSPHSGTIFSSFIASALFVAANTFEMHLNAPLSCRLAVLEGVNPHLQ